METKKVKLLKVLAYPVSAAFMLGVGTVAINACEQNTDASACIAETEVVEQEQEIEEIVENETMVEEEPSEDVSVTDQIELGSEANEELANYDEIVDSQPLEDENQNEVNNPVAQVNGKQYETLQGAIDAANEGDTVTVIADSNESLTMSKAITLDLNGHTLTAPSGNRILTINITGNVSQDASVIIKNGTFKDGVYEVSGKFGGAISVYASSESIPVTISNIVFDNNAAYKGGALFVQQGAVTVDSCTFTNNKATATSSAEGGAIYANNGGYVMSGSLVVKNSKFEQNHSNANGGAIKTGYDSTIENNEFINNSADNAGGAISYDSNSHTSTVSKLINNTMTGNSAEVGGAIHSGNSDYRSTGLTNTIILEGGTISNNTSNTTSWYIGGGAIYLVGNGTRFTMNGGTITGNTTTGCGGAIYSSNWGGITINAGTIEKNSATYYGGGIYISNPNSSINTVGSELVLGANVTITGNSAMYGGGLYIGGYDSTQQNVTADLTTGVKIYNNTASVADDVYAVENNLVTIKNNFSGEKLNGCNHSINGWYWDNYDATKWQAHKSSEEGSYYVAKMQEGTYNAKLCLKAAHGLAKVTVEYVYKDGTTASESVVQDVEYGGSFEIQSPEINGYQADIGTVSGSIEETNRTLKVVYSKLYNYAINYDANGGTGAPASKKEETTDEQKTFTISSVVPSRDGYTFKGWATSKDAKESDVSESVTLDTENTEITLYAIWEKNPDPVVPDKKDSNSNNKSTSKKVVSVKTSTATNMIPTIGLMGVSLAGIVALKKKNED